MGSEADAIAATQTPGTAESLAHDLRALGLKTGAVVMVHSSLSALGWVAGGAQSVVEALLDTVGPTGTIVMPAQTGQLSDPGQWNAPAVPAEWIPTVRDRLPAFDPDLTPTRGMGAVVECFRCLPATRRSSHPLVSFVAHGPLADEIVAEHPLEQSMDDRSPLGRLYELDATVLLLGVDHGNNTSIHLAEHRAEWDGKANRVDSAPMLVDGVRRWVSYEELDHDDSDFAPIGEAFATTGAERTGSIGAGSARSCRQRDVVDFAVAWMPRHRPGSLVD